MIYERYPNELTHHGIKGMKWGVRKKQWALNRDYKRSLRSAKKASRKSFNSNAEDYQAYRKKENAAWRATNKKAKRLGEKAVVKTKKLEKRNKNMAYQVGKDAAKKLIAGTLASAAIIDIKTDGQAHKTAAYMGKKAVYNTLSKVRDSVVSERAAKSVIKIAAPVAAKTSRIAKGVYYTR